MPHRILTTFGVVLIVAAAASGCSKSPQDRYDDAVSSLNDAQKSLNDAKNRVQSARQQVQQAQQSYQQAQQKLDATRQDIQKARQNVAQDATDQILFRVLQRDVLKKSQFENAAISVGVEQRVVTLTGSVPDKSTRDDAVKLVKQQPGVAHVVDRLNIGDDQSNAPNPSSNGQNPNQGNSNN